MSDALRAVPMHEVGATPAKKRSVPVEFTRADGSTGVVVPEPPTSGTKVLTSTNGVLSWEDAA